MRVSFTPELVAHIKHRYETTQDSLETIAAAYAVSIRTVGRLRDGGGWMRNAPRLPRGLPPAMRALQEANALLAAPAATAPPPETGRPDCEADPHNDSHPASLHAATLLHAEGGNSSAIERIERLVEQELAAEEAVRARFGPLPRPPADAARARTLATLTQTLHALQRMRGGLTTNSEWDDDDDMPLDIDEFRLDLARRIDAFVASQTDPSDADHDPEASPVATAG